MTKFVIFDATKPYSSTRSFVQHCLAPKKQVFTNLVKIYFSSGCDLTNFSQEEFDAFVVAHKDGPPLNASDLSPSAAEQEKQWIKDRIRELDSILSGI